MKIFVKSGPFYVLDVRHAYYITCENQIDKKHHCLRKSLWSLNIGWTRLLTNMDDNWCCDVVYLCTVSPLCFTKSGLSLNKQTISMWDREWYFYTLQLNEIRNKIEIIISKTSRVGTTNSRNDSILHSYHSIADSLRPRKMAPIMYTTFSNAFPCTKSLHLICKLRHFFTSPIWKYIK